MRAWPCREDDLEMTWGCGLIACRSWTARFACWANRGMKQANQSEAEREGDVGVLGLASNLAYVGKVCPLVFGRKDQVQSSG